MEGQENNFYEVFCHMMIEDFLLRKGMQATLKSLRDEWDRPSEERVCNSWYEVALKLRLPELVSQNSKFSSIMENLVQALVREASVRCRQTPEVLMTGLAAMPKSSSLPTIVDPHKSKLQLSSNSSPQLSPGNINRPSSNGDRLGNTVSGNLKGDAVKEIAKDRHGQNQHANRHSKSTAVGTKTSNGRGKPLVLLTSGVAGAGGGLPHHHVSSENWIPDDIRMRSMLRDLSAAKETFTAIRKREVEYEREMKRLLVSDLDRAKTEESLDATRKIPCGCCTQMFLYVNLPLKVSRKAILDIRIKWSGMLSSATVFDPVGTSSGNYSQLMGDMNNGTGDALTGKNLDEQLFSGGNLGQVPRCYDHVGVCVFCAQFFQVQEDYRPSYEAITYQERKAAFLETKRRELEYWDPLKMIEKDRVAAAVSAAARTALLNSTGAGMGQADATGSIGGESSTASSRDVAEK